MEYFQELQYIQQLQYKHENRFKINGHELKYVRKGTLLQNFIREYVDSFPVTHFSFERFSFKVY